MKTGCIRNVAEWSMYENSAKGRSDEFLQHAFNKSKYSAGVPFDSKQGRAWRQAVRRELRKRRLGT